MSSSPTSTSSPTSRWLSSAQADLTKHFKVKVVLEGTKLLISRLDKDYHEWEICVDGSNVSSIRITQEASLNCPKADRLLRSIDPLHSADASTIGWAHLFLPRY